MSDYIFDDNSIAAKVLQQEIEAQVIQVKDGKLEDWLSLISEEGITKVYLHYCYEDYTPGLRAEIHSELAKNPNLRIICQYENNPRSDIEKRAFDYHIALSTYSVKPWFKAIKHTEIASDSLTPKELGGHEVPSNEFVQALLDAQIRADKISAEKSGLDVKELFGDTDKVKVVNYGKYTVGGNDSLRSDKVERTEDPFIKKQEEYKSKRRRKKKNADES